MKSIVLTLLCFFSLAGLLNGQTLTLKSELERMITRDHLYKPKNFKTFQFSGFNRDGNNPDDVDYLYKEDGWFVYADCEGPGVVSRIWSTFRAHRGWGRVKLEVNGKVIFKGRFEDFFSGKIPFAAPLCEKKELTHRKGVKRGLCYVPIPFSKRFRFMQDTRNYNQINVRQYPPETKVESFSAELSESSRALWKKAAKHYKNPNHFFRKIRLNQSLKRINRNMLIEAEKSGQTITLKGPGIIKGIFAKADPRHYDGLMLQIFWDEEEEPAIHVPLGLGFGSFRQQTFLLGTTEQGERGNGLPMPFMEAAKIRIINLNDETFNVSLKIAYQKKKAESLQGSRYLYGLYKHGYFSRRFSNYNFPNAGKEDFFYKNGYRVLDLTAEGHLVAYIDLFNCQPELDEHIYIDRGRTFPENAWNGTGHEDHFNMAYGHYNHSSAYVSGGSQSLTEANTRIYWNAPPVFKELIRFNWEWAPNIYKYPRRDAEFYSVVYWYMPPVDG